MLTAVLQSSGRIETYDGSGSGMVASSGTSASPWPQLAVVLLLGVAVWVLVARSSLVRGGSMERPERVPQLYGYSVCLIAIIVMLVSANSIVDNAFTLADPLRSESGPFAFSGGPVLTSFEAFKATDGGRFTGPRPPNARADSAARPTEEELRARYETLRADRVARARRAVDAQRGAALITKAAADSGGGLSPPSSRLMNRQRTSAALFIAAGVVFLGVSTMMPRGATWLVLGIVFIVLGAARLRRAS